MTAPLSSTSSVGWACHFHASRRQPFKSFGIDNEASGRRVGAEFRSSDSRLFGDHLAAMRKLALLQGREGRWWSGHSGERIRATRSTSKPFWPSCMGSIELCPGFRQPPIRAHSSGYSVQHARIPEWVRSHRNADLHVVVSRKDFGN